MSSEKDKDGYTFRCDAKGCSEFWTHPSLGVGSEKADWADCWSRAKSEGWRARPGDGKQWLHFCPSCPARN